MRRSPGDPALDLGIDSSDLSQRMNRLDSIYDSASDGPGEIAKAKLRGLAEFLRWDPPNICRAVARMEAARDESEIQPLLEGLESVLLKWRAE